MNIGIPKEVKNHEYRVGLTPSSVFELTQAKHTVFFESGAGNGSGFKNIDFVQAGGRCVPNAEELFEQSELIIKVKEPQKQERSLLNQQHTLFTYLHLAPDAGQTNDLVDSGATCIAYEMVSDKEGRLPLLLPMSEIAGRMSIQAGAHCLEKTQGGCGIMLGGVPGVHRATVLILGGGVVGSNAARIAIGMGARVIVMDKSLDTLRGLDSTFGNTIQTIFSTTQNLLELLPKADLVVGAALVPGANAPKLIRRQDLKLMKPGSVLVDVAIDQGGCFETSKPTTHQTPTYIIDDIVHYCVTNMPGALPKTATTSLNNATLPYILDIANKGVKQALIDNKDLCMGLSIVRHTLTCPAVGLAQNINSVTATDGLALL